MNHDRPSSEVELKAILDSAYSLARKSQYDQALSVCDWLIEDKATELAGYRERAAVKEHMSDIVGAIGDLQTVIAHPDKEPADFHSLGLLLLQNGDTVDAIGAFNQAIVLGTEANFHYYTNSSHLFRAVAHLKRTNFAEALADVVRLPTGYKANLPDSGMHSKEDIATEAKAGLASKLTRRFL